MLPVGFGSTVVLDDDSGDIGWRDGSGRRRSGSLVTSSGHTRGSGFGHSGGGSVVQAAKLAIKGSNAASCISEATLALRELRAGFVALGVDGFDDLDLVGCVFTELGDLRFGGDAAALGDGCALLGCGDFADGVAGAENSSSHQSDSAKE